MGKCQKLMKKCINKKTEWKKMKKFRIDWPLPSFRQSDDEDGAGQEVGVAGGQTGQEGGEGVSKIRTKLKHFGEKI